MNVELTTGDKRVRDRVVSHEPAMKITWLESLIQNLLDHSLRLGCGRKLLLKQYNVCYHHCDQYLEEAPKCDVALPMQRVSEDRANAGGVYQLGVVLAAFQYFLRQLRA